MPEIVFDYNAIREHLHGDDWYQPQRDMVEAARNVGQCVQNREPTPDEYINKAGSVGMPCTTAPTPPIPCGQPPNPHPFGQAGCNQQDQAAGVVGGIARPEWMQAPAPKEIYKLKNVPPEVSPEIPEYLAQGAPQALMDNDPRNAVTTLVNVIDDQMLKEKCAFQEKLARFQSMVEQVRTRRDRIHYENAIEDEHRRYQERIAPMLRQKEWLINQLTQTMSMPPRYIAEDYKCEDVREVDMRTHKRK